MSKRNKAPKPAAPPHPDPAKADPVSQSTFWDRLPRNPQILHPEPPKDTAA